MQFAYFFYVEFNFGQLGNYLPRQAMVIQARVAVPYRRVRSNVTPFIVDNHL